MALGLFRLRMPDGGHRLARGTPESGPAGLLAPGLTIGGLLGGDGSRFRMTLEDPLDPRRPVPADAVVVAPVDDQEIWASGVTYRRSRDARKDESIVADVYDLVYAAERPELFFKAAAWRVRGPGDDVGIRADSAWDVPEPELALVIASDGTIVGHVIGNDMSSRSIEGANPLYLPQAKIYDGSCALGPCIVPTSPDGAPLGIHLSIEREGAPPFAASTSTSEITRAFTSLAQHLVQALTLPAGAVLLTGTGIVPPAHFTLREGDVVRIRIDGLGELVNRVVVVGQAEGVAGESSDVV